jgi:hypothetical protein
MCFSDIQLWCSNAQIHRRKNLIDLDGWDPMWSCASDTDLILRVLEQGGTVCHTPYPGILYRKRQNSVSDQFREKGLLRWEGTLIHLRSLSRYYQMHNSLNTTLRKSWCRYWHNFQSMKNGHNNAIFHFHETQRNKLQKAINEILPPPAWVRCEGWLRHQLWRFVHFLK